MKPLIFFVHVPKTAGTTVNAMLKAHMPNGRAHVEAILGNDEAFRKSVDALDWMSGHVSRDKAMARIREFTTRPVRFFACVRHATMNLISHYNWLFVKGSEFSEGTRPNAMHQAMKDNGFAPEGVIKTLMEFPDLLNFQTSFLLKSDFEGSDEAFRSALAHRFELISIDPDAALSAMLGRRTSTMRRDNVASYMFDPSVFYDKKVLGFLEKNNQKDETVYRLVSTFRGKCNSDLMADSISEFECADTASEA